MTVGEFLKAVSSDFNINYKVKGGVIELNQFKYIKMPRKKKKAFKKLNK